MEKGNKVYWYYNGKQYSGVLDERTEVVGVMGIEPNSRLKDVNYYSWDITGEDLKSYSVPESDLYLEPIKN